ncbi:MAG TPA: hypothetical protein VNZ03_15545 [Terriglobales bacterium]|jgi:hypothetical protein|nr:hypothetical protein [Terriglobales bacterium]
MPAMHAALGQPSSVQGISFSPVAIGLVLAFNESLSIAASARFVADQCHAPPILSPPSVLPLRI